MTPHRIPYPSWSYVWSDNCQLQTNLNVFYAGTIDAYLLKLKPEKYETLS